MKLTSFSFLTTLTLGLGIVTFSPMPQLRAADEKTVEKTPATQPSAAVNKMCPVAGDEIDPAVTTTYEGKTIAFCCKSCVAKFQKNPEKYMKDLK